MTATEVDGVKVVREGPTLAPITTGRGRGGSAIWWDQTRTLELADGRIVYGCKHCDHTTTRVGGIRPHLRVHADPDAPRKPRKVRTTGDPQVDALIKTLSKASDNDERVGYWKARALEAERKNARIKKALDALGFRLPAGSE